MKISHNWLQTYFAEPLPKPADILHELTFHIFEVESIEEHVDAKGILTDTVYDIKVLPDRAPYCLSHKGIAQELAILLKKEIITPEFSTKIVIDQELAVSVNVEDSTLCDRYIATKISGILNAENNIASPTWLVQKLEALGQRSINLIVDLTNYVMLDIGQPMHAFDTNKVSGNIVVRKAKAGEKITTLDNKEISLDETILIIADDVGPLAIAGVKGGNRASVDKNTTDIILEAAHFEYSNIRKTSQKVGIKNDSSKRFENRISATKAPLAVKEFISLLQKEADAQNFLLFVGAPCDINNSQKSSEQKSLFVSVDEINNILGTKISAEQMGKILSSCNITTAVDGDVLNLTIPVDRPDLEIVEDIAEEVGRIYGYNNIKGIIPPGDNSSVFRSKYQVYTTIIKAFLKQKGYSELYNYTLTNTGDVEIANPLASDKSFVRSNLSTGVEKSLDFNINYADLLGVDRVKVFEIGKVFTAHKNNLTEALETAEHNAFAIGVKNTNAFSANKKNPRSNDTVKEIRDEFFAYISAQVEILCTIDDGGGIVRAGGKQIGMTNTIDGITEINLDALVATLPEISPEVLQKLADTEKELLAVSGIKYKSISAFPFITRDIAVFVPGEEGNQKQVLDIIKQHSGDLAVRIDLFDVFTKRKEGEPVKTSYAYRIVFQSKERTLTSEEIDVIMKKITDVMNEKEGWQVR